MPIQFPDYSYRHLESYTACALVDSRHPDYEDDPLTLYSQYETPNGTILVRLIINNQDSPFGTHVHIDTIRESAVENPPESNASIEDVLDELSNIDSYEVSVRGIAKFDLPSSSLPKIGVISLLRQVMTGPADANVRLTGSTFEMDNGPVTSLEWSICDEYGDDESIRAEVYSETQLRWQDDYIIESLQPAIEAFRTFVLEEPVASEVDHG